MPRKFLLFVVCPAADINLISVIECFGSITDQCDALSKIKCLWSWSGFLLLSLANFASAHFIFSIIGGRFLPESTPLKYCFFCNLVVLVNLYQSQGCRPLKKFDFIFCMPLSVLRCDVFVMFIPVLKICLLFLGWPGIDPLPPRFQMRFFPRRWLSITLDGMTLNWMVSSSHRLVRHCSACPFWNDWKYASTRLWDGGKFYLFFFNCSPFLGLATLAQPNCSIAHLLFLLLLPDSWHLRWFNNAMEQSKLCSSVCCSLAGDCVQFSVWFALLLSCRFLNYGLMNIVSVSTVLRSSNRWTSWWLTGVFLEITSTTFSLIFRMYYQFLSWLCHFLSWLCHFFICCFVAWQLISFASAIAFWKKKKNPRP